MDMDKKAEKPPKEKKKREEEGKKEKMRKEEKRSVLQRSNKDQSMVGAKIPLGSLVVLIASGQKKEKPAGTQKKSGSKEALAAHYFSQSQPQLQLSDSHGGPIQLTQGGHLFTTSVVQSNTSGGTLYSTPFSLATGIGGALGQSVATSGAHLFTTSSSQIGATSQPSKTSQGHSTTAPVRHHTTLPPKKSLSPSRMAAIVEQQQRMELAASQRLEQVAVPASQQTVLGQETPQTSSQLAQHVQQLLTVPAGRQSTDVIASEESGGLLRQHLLKRDHHIFSAYQHAPNFNPLEGSRESPSPRGQATSHQSRKEVHREEIRGQNRGQTVQVPNINLATLAQLKKEQEQGTQGHQLGMLESEAGLQRGNIQLQKIIIPQGGENIRLIGSPGKNELYSYSQQGLKAEHRLSPLSHQVSTIRRTPSPAHMSSERHSPAPPHGVVLDQGERMQPVNLSTHETNKKHTTSITSAHSHLTGSIVTSTYHQQKPKHRTGKDQHHSRQEDFTKIRDPGEIALSQGEGSISIPSKIMSTVQSAGKMQTEILRQTLLRGVPSTQAPAPSQHGRPSTIRSLDAGPVTWKYDADGHKKFVTTAAHIASVPNVELQHRPGRVERKGPSPHQTPIAQPSAEHKRFSPGPPSAFHTTPQSSSSSSTSSHQQPIRYTISAASLSPSGPGEPSQTIPHIPQHKAPSPKPQHRHKDMSALQHTIQHPPTGLSAQNLQQNVGAIRQPVVSLVKLEDVKHQFQSNVPVAQSSQFTVNQRSEPMQEVVGHRPHVSEIVTHRPHAAEQIETSSHQRVPFSQIPPSQQVNPFTFPPKAIISQSSLLAYHQHKTDHQRDRHEFDSKGSTPPPNVSLHQEYRATDRPDEMPRLDPISPRVPLEDSKHKDLPEHDLLEKTAEYVTMKNPFNMRIVTLGNLPTTSLYRSTYRAHSVAVHRAKAASIVSAAKSLDLLRQTLQKGINKEIDVIIQQYMEKFFKPGIENIKVNNGSSAVSEEHIQAVCRQILEEAKKMYLTDQGRQSVTPTRDIPDNVSDTGSTGSKKMPFVRKRKTSDTDSEKSHSTIPKRKKGRPPLYVSGRSTPSKLKANEPVRREGPKWDHERITINSHFIMGARANKALGLGATRGRIYIKHPDLFKYSGDQDDKQWLYENHHMPATGGKAYMLLLEDVKELANDDEYRDNSNLLLNELVGFTITDWMIEKVKAQMIANRTDTYKKGYRSRSTTPSEVPASVPQDDELERDEHKTLPFSSFSSPKVLQLDKEFQNSPSGDTEMDFLSGADNDDHTLPGMSPFNITGGFDDGTSPSPSELDPLDEDARISAPFELTN